MTISIEYLPPHALKARPRAWQLLSTQEIEAARAWLRQHALPQPVLVDSEDRVVWGLTYVEAAKLERLNQLPVSRVDDLSD
jgi:hypothetical protein